MRKLLLALCILPLCSLQGKKDTLANQGELLALLATVAAQTNESGLWLQSSMQHVFSRQHGIWYSPDGSKLVTASRYQRFIKPKREPIPERSAFHAADEAYHCSEEKTELMNIWDLSNGQPVATYTIPENKTRASEAITAIAFDQSGNTIACKGLKGTYYFDIASGTPPAAQFPVTHWQESSNGQLSDGTVQVTPKDWPDQGLEVKRLSTLIGTLYHGTRAPNELRSGFALNPKDSREIATAGYNWQAKVWYWVDETLAAECRPEDLTAMQAIINKTSSSVPSGATPGVAKIFRHLTWQPNGKQQYLPGSDAGYAS